MSILTQIVQESIVKLLSLDISEGLRRTWGLFRERSKGGIRVIVQTRFVPYERDGYCSMMGQVTGTAAVQSVCERKAAANISVADLQQKLATDGILNR